MDILKLERMSYRGWFNAYRFANRLVEIVIVADIGPRVLSFRATDGENQFYIVPEQAGLSGGDVRRLYGGHRLWAAPETPQTFVPDNMPAEVILSEQSACFTAQHSPGPDRTRLQKAIEISLDPVGARCRVTHRISNTGDNPCCLSPWAITMLRPGGKAIIPFARRRVLSESSLAPEEAIVFWPYADLSDYQWALRQSYLEFSAKTGTDGLDFPQQKFGVRTQSSWGAYLRHGTLFVKRTRWQSQAQYPDLGCNFEVYTESAFLELESLGPLECLKPGAALTHVEEWLLFEGIEDGTGNNWLEQEIVSRIPQSFAHEVDTRISLDYGLERGNDS
jgi:hypothetical protein